MSIISVTGIDKTKIKTRWEEPYVSSALNKVMSSLPRGIYRGMAVSELATPGAGVSISMDPSRGDSLVLHEDLTNGYKTAIRFDADFDLTFTFTDGTRYYIWIDVVYVESSETLGYLRIGEAADLAAAPNAIPFASFLSTGGVINTADISQDRTNPTYFLSPRPDTSEDNPYGLINQDEYDRFPTQDEKDAMDNAASPSSSNPFSTESGTIDKSFAQLSMESVTGLSAATEFQLTGTFYVGTGAAGTAEQWFALFGVNSYIGLRATDGKAITVSQIWDATNNHQLDPSTEATGGYYTNPYVKMSLPSGSTSYTGDLAVRCLTQETYSSLDALALDPNSFGIQPDISGSLYGDVTYNTGRRPVSFTVGPYTSSHTDFNQHGSRSLMEAVKYLATSGHGGIIFVKKGSYIWDESVSLGSNIHIICEPGDSGHLVTIDFQHPSGYAIDATKGFTLKNAQLSVSGVSSDVIDAGTAEYICNLVDVDLTDGTIRIDGPGKFHNVTVSAPSGTSTPAAIFDGGEIFVDDCFFQGGPAMEIVDNRTFTATFRRCRFEGPSADDRVITSGASGFKGLARFEDCTFVYKGGGTQTANAKADFILGEGAQLAIDGLKYEKLSNVTADIHAPYLRVACIGKNALATLMNVNIMGASEGYYATTDLPSDVGVVMLSASAGSASNSTIEVNGLLLHQFKGQSTADRSRLVAIQAIDATSSIRIERLKVYDCNATDTVDTYLYALRTYGGGTGQGKIYIVDPDITLDIDYPPTSGALYTYGIFIDQPDLGLGALVSIEGGKIVDCYYPAIFIETNYGGDLIVRGVTGILSTKYNDKTPIHRWVLAGTGRKTVVGNVFTDNSNCIDYSIIVIAGAGECSVFGNCLYHNQPVGDAIYFEDEVLFSPILGNSGQGRINVLDLTNFAGIGDTGYDANTVNLNSLAVNLR